MIIAKEKILILSHTGSHSTFKIGSHHYANMLSNLGYEVFYSGVSNSLLHKIWNFINKKEISKKKVNDEVLNKDIVTLLPLTMKKIWFKDVVNDFFVTQINKNNPIFNTEFDIVICDYPFFYPLLKKIKYKKLIYRPTDNYTSMSGDKVRFYEKRICNEAQKIISTSETVKKQILNNYGLQLEDRSYVIENGYDQTIFYNKNDNINRENCIYIGALDYRFDYEALKCLSKENPAILFDIYGPKPKDFSSSVEPHFVNCDNVNFKGSVDYDSVPDILNRYRVGLLPLTDSDSNKGRSPMKLWEYLSCGLNVVYSNIDHVGKIPCVYQYNSLSDINDSFHKAYYHPEIKNNVEVVIESNSWSAKVSLLLSYIE
ncbi:glycosyltransferase [Raoultella ornithinolytica]|uniref:glycosyltransferase n=1 Tax=Raoultella ornithinolytica TaxID=54291 RepID=UPI0013EF7A95|nr:glycosyltransferase [Raoultella ornithinolytica]HED3057747.1 glycosyltransferase [Raoultella ornithinolytica]